MAACLPNHKEKECIGNRSITKTSGKTSASSHRRIQTHFHTYFFGHGRKNLNILFNIINFTKKKINLPLVRTAILRTENVQ